MPPKVPQIVCYSVSASGRLSILVDRLNDTEDGQKELLYLQEKGRSGRRQVMQFVSDVQDMKQFHGLLEEGKQYYLVSHLERNRFVRLEIPRDSAKRAATERSGLIGRLLGLFRPISAYLRFEHLDDQEWPRVITHHDSIHIWLPNSVTVQLMSRNNRSVVSSNRTNDGKGNRFSAVEFRHFLENVADGESLWDFRLNEGKKTRLSFQARRFEDPRKKFKYPWFWLSDENFVAKARVYWTKDGHLALKVIKKGLGKV